MRCAIIDKEPRVYSIESSYFVYKWLFGIWKNKDSGALWLFGLILSM